MYYTVHIRKTPKETKAWRQDLIILNSEPTRSKFTWTQAWDTCSSSGGELPIFTSRGQYEEFADFMGYASHFSITELVFVKCTSQVRFFQHSQ